MRVRLFSTGVTLLAFAGRGCYAAFAFLEALFAEAASADFFIAHRFLVASPMAFRAAALIFFRLAFGASGVAASVSA